MKSFNRLVLLISVLLLALPAVGFAQTAEPPVSAPAAPDVVTDAELVAWAIFLIIVAVVFMVATVGINRWANHLENKTPPWMQYVSPFAPAAYQQAQTGWDMGTAWARQEAQRRTPNIPFDDQLIAIVDENGDKLLVRVAQVFGYEPVQSQQSEAVRRAQVIHDMEAQGYQGEPGDPPNSKSQ